MIFKSVTDWILLLLPAVVGYSAAAFCKMDKGSGASVKARPPSWVFGVVWPVLYLFLGFVWAIMKTHGAWVNTLFALNTAVLALWIVVYSCGKNKKAALYVLLIAVVLALMVWGHTVQHGGVGMYLLAPYVGWLVFALLLNFQDVNNS